MKSKILLLLLSLAALVLGSSSQLAAASHPAARNTTFDTFVALDHQLTLLDQEMEKAKDALANSDANSESAQPQPLRPWAQAAHNMQPTVTAILHASDRLEHVYAGREARLHRPLFHRMLKRARALRNNVRLLSEARTRRWARVVQARLSKALVAYVFDFQLVSGGYAALRCQTAQTACCEPVRKDPGAPFSCKWACSQTASCRAGFPGPQIGPSFEHPLTAAR